MPYTGPIITRQIGPNVQGTALAYNQMDNNLLYLEQLALSLTGATGPGIPSGGTTGQVLAKTSATDYDATWQDSTVTYSNTGTTPDKVGGIAEGSTFNNRTMKQMWDALLYPYQSPGFSSFGILFQSSSLEVGTPIAQNRAFTWSVTDADNIEPDTITIKDVTGGNVTIATGLNYTASPYTSTYPAITNSSPTTHTFSIQGLNNRSQGFTRPYSVSWNWKLYYGTSASETLDEAGIQALSLGNLTSNKNGVYSFVALNYKYFAWADSLGSPTAKTGFKDTSTGVKVVMAGAAEGYLQSQNEWNYKLIPVANSNGVTTNYRLYRTLNTIGGSINIQVS